jgi:hypothetical protein
LGRGGMSGTYRNGCEQREEESFVSANNRKTGFQITPGNRGIMKMW